MTSSLFSEQLMCAKRALGWLPLRNSQGMCTPLAQGKSLLKAPRGLTSSSRVGLQDTGKGKSSWMYQVLFYRLLSSSNADIRCEINPEMLFIELSPGCRHAV